MDRDACFQASFYESLYQGGGNSFVPCPQSLASGSSSVPWLTLNQMSPWMSIGAFGPQIQSSMAIEIAIQDHSKLYLAVNSHPKNGLILFKSTLRSRCGAPAERDIPFPKPFIYALLHSYLLDSQVRELSHETQRERNHSLSMVAWFPKGNIYDMLLLSQCHAICGTIPSTLAWVDQSHYPLCVTVIP